MMVGMGKKTHLPLIPRGPTRGQDAVLDTAGSEMVEHGVVGHDEHAGVVLVRRRAVQDGFAQEHGQRGGWREVRLDTLRALVLLVVRVEEVEVDEEGGDVGGVAGSG